MALLTRASRIAGVVTTPGGPQALLRWRPFSVASFRLVRGLAAEGLSFRTVIDAGANIGQFSRAALGTWPQATVIAFEALPEAARRLRAGLAEAGHLEVHDVALGAEDGTTSFRPHASSLSSSVLAVSPDLQERYPWAREHAAIEVPLRRLDTVLEGRALERPLLLKLDVQGFELEVLRGAPHTLALADALLIEQAFDSAYEGQPLFPEAHGFVEAAGWRLVRPLDMRLEGGRITEVDCLYLPPA